MTRKLTMVKKVRCAWLSGAHTSEVEAAHDAGQSGDEMPTYDDDVQIGRHLLLQIDRAWRCGRRHYDNGEVAVAGPIDES